MPKDLYEGLESSYREKGHNDKHFRYFIGRVMPAVNANITRYNRRKGKDLLSEIFTVSDEAYALTLLDNYEERWRRQSETEKSDWNKEGFPKPKYTDCKSGRKAQTWSKEGMETYNKWCHKIKEMRTKDESGLDLEEALRDEHSKAKGKHGSSDASTASTSNDSSFISNMFMDDEAIELFAI